MFLYAKATILALCHTLLQEVFFYGNIFTVCHTISQKELFYGINSGAFTIRFLLFHKCMASFHSDYHTIR